jgi:hypothetical protein
MCQTLLSAVNYGASTDARVPTLLQWCLQDCCTVLGMHPGHPLALQGLQQSSRVLKCSTRSSDVAAWAKWQDACEAAAAAHTAIQHAAVDMPAFATAATSVGSRDSQEAARVAGKHFAEFCQLPDVIDMVQQQQQPVKEPPQQDMIRLSECVLLLHAYAAAVEVCPQRMQAYTCESVADLARIASWGQQRMLSSSGGGGSSRRKGAQVHLYDSIWSAAVTLLTLLLRTQPGSACPSAEALLDETVHALDSSGGLWMCDVCFNTCTSTHLHACTDSAAAPSRRPWCTLDTI